MDDNAKRIGSAIFTTLIIIIWIALRAESCKSESEYDNFSYDYTPPSGLYTPQVDYSSTLDKAKQALDDLMAKDADYKPQVEATDAIAIAYKPKSTQCQALDSVIEQTPTWKVEVSEHVMSDGATKTAVVSPYPMYVIHDEDVTPPSSPEAIARVEVMIGKLGDGATPTVPSLTTKDLLIQTTLMPKPAKGAKRIKGAIAPGTPIVKAWIYDHRENRVVCAGIRAIPEAAKGADGLFLTEAQLAKLVQDVPSALKTIELEGIHVEEPPPQTKKKS